MAWWNEKYIEVPEAQILVLTCYQLAGDFGMTPPFWSLEVFICRIRERSLDA